MKKLMIGAVAAMLGIAANAAAVSWELDDCYTYAGAGKTSSTLASDGSGYAVYICTYYNAGTGAEPSYVGTSRADALAAIEAGDLSFLTGSGVIAGEWADAGVIYNEDELPAGRDPVQNYAIILNGSIDDATAAFVSDGYDRKTTGSNVGYSLTIDMSDSATGNNWQTVPEPTSGLLLLLGVAGLALKRRRA